MNEKDAAIVKILTELGLREEPSTPQEFEFLYPKHNLEEQFYADVLRLFEDSEDEMKRLFNRTASAQRGQPEKIMVRIQFALGGGVYSFVIEHVGDLTHRMSEHINSFKGQYNIVKDKVEKTLRMLKSDYGFEREHQQNLRNNFKYYKQEDKLPEGVKTFDDWVDHIKQLSKKYADAHRQVPVYNWIQWTARQAAVELGEWNFEFATLYLSKLERLLKEGREEYQRQLMQYHVDYGERHPSK